MAMEMQQRGDRSPVPGSGTAVASAAYLVWEDLMAVLPSYGGRKVPRKLIQGISGYAVPGRIMAIMGPSGSGKSTLLDSLAGLLYFNI